ncbi:RimJ/RimL family protein N-acetyltransferase [Nocardia tenerifensis]|uniref:RimJ/RimL family protein N-acetyltransferase n=1 Tax=Nocardia tenerifensis TaxID=228006 RepID=A0A318K1P2_9NOCA|nr:GNAT family N-acetyltransferase [Nocardia tenerifensis]PXX61595.1 RimJ/RimL family protein N-acetyltransferase [Nocardia tenerifensis]
MPVLTAPLVAAETFTDSAQPVIATGDGLLLRPWTTGDAPAVFEAFSDPSIQRWHVRSASSIAEVEGWLEAWAGAWSTAAAANWAVTDVTTGRLVGRASLKGLALADGQAEVAYWTMPAARGRAVTPRAIAAVTTWAFGVGFHRLQLTHSVANKASCRVAAKLGYALEGTLRSAGLHVDGWHDMHLHGRIGSGYPAGMSGPEKDQTTAEVQQGEADFAEEHSKPTHADEHPKGAELETDESTPDGHAGMD